MLSGLVPDSPEYFAGRAGDSPFSFGARIPAGMFLAKPVLAWFHPEVPPEKPIPFTHRVIFADHHLLVVDKPHFLPTTSNGRLVRETLQTRVASQGAVPLHRLDRLTAGVVVCSVNPDTRAAYQQLFAARAVEKTYQATLTAPLEITDTVRLGMRKAKGTRQVSVDPNGTLTETHVHARGVAATFRPVTGHTHQLRVLANYLGAPIVGDDTYPVDKGLDLYDFSAPLQLLASRVEFVDPLSGKLRQFSSLSTLGTKL
ncbi:pseudouridine synthase [Corynebacterium phocae]|uniref:RNA pseudouridylate synthase n=1 Tax=Corynebacterium phocae TaxID=161895 RepID=A0A1L7D4G0_9CORY|nr:pseudouridine synthase [Corynebacterium phocae]APT92822.1 pseudouridine synthase [Corynebacterium phocae]KAA8723139.1 pseudouridine synthase [Corynebacterium phocae]